MSTTTFTSPAAPLRAPPLSLLATEPLRAVFDYVSSRFSAGPLAMGDGHPVVVYPGLGGGAFTTSHLRGFLQHSGFTVHDWKGGINTGPEGQLDDWLGSLEQRVQDLRTLHGRKVSLVGWSLGGVYAREIAKRCPTAVRQVITLGTPFAAMGDANHAVTVYRLLNGGTSQLTAELAQRLRQTPPVPTTSIYSKNDGIVSWRACIEKNSARSESVEVTASHLGMVTHPEVLRIVADRLALPDGQWRALRRLKAG